MGNSGEQVENSSVTHKTYEELFKSVLPYYLSIGMSYEQFYQEDPELVSYYREAQRLKDISQNEFLWLQGMYFREALAEIISKCFGGNKSIKYPVEPYPLTQEEADKREEKNRQDRMENLRQSLLKNK